jgi:hypothetical protein
LLTFASFSSPKINLFTMTNYILLSADFERQKKIRASAITLGVAGALVLLFILIKWPLPTSAPPQFEELIEVNLGSGDFGSGTDQPMLPGTPAPAQQVAYTPPQPIQSNVSESKDIDTDDRVSNTAPEIKRPSIAKPNATKIDNDNKTAKPVANTQPVVAQTPPRPRAVMGTTMGGTGNGGNGADTYKPGTGEGIAGGQGDQGRVGGSPTGTNYSGAPRNFGVKVLNIPAQSFEDDFNENAKIAMDITTDASGKVVSATYQPRGSTTSNRQMIDIARRRAFELKNISAGEGPAKGTVIFSFQVRS